MPSTWFIVKPDRQLGPYTSAQMKQLAASGQLKTDDQVRRADQQTPVAAGKIRGLFPENECPDRPKTTPPPLPSERSESGTPELSLPSLPSNEASQRPKTPPPPLPSERTKNGTSDSSGPPPLPSSRTKLEDIRKTLGDLTETTKAAGHLAFAEVRKARLVKITLPAAYLALGRDIFTTGRFRSEYPELYSSKTSLPSPPFLPPPPFYAEIERVQAEITRLTTRRDGKPGGTFAERAKQTASMIKDAAQAKALGLKMDSLMRQLGEVGFADQREKSGPESFVQPISECLNKIGDAEEQIRQQSAVSQGRSITPRRILYGVIGTVALIVLLTVFNRPQETTHVVQDTTRPSPLPSPPSGDEKFKAFREVVQVYKQSPDEYAGSEKRQAFNKRLRGVQQKFSAIPFDPTKDRNQARQIIQVFRDELENKYSGQLYIEIEDEVRSLYETIIK